MTSVAAGPSGSRYIGVAGLLAAAVAGTLIVERFGGFAIPLVILLLLVVGGGVSLVERPEIAAIGAIAAAPLIAYRHDVLNTNLTLQRLLLIVGGLILVAHIAAGRRQKLVRSPAVVFFASFVLLKVLDLLRTQKVIYSLRQISIILVGLALILFALHALRTRRAMRMALLLTVVVSPAPVFLGVSQSFAAMQGEMPKLPFQQYFSAREDDDPRLTSSVAYTTGAWGSAVRANGTLGGPVAFGEYLAQMIALVGGLLIAARLRPGYRAMLFAYMIVLGTMLVASFSRSAWIIGLVGIGTVFLAHSADGNRRALASSLVAGASIVLVLAAGIGVVWAFYPDALTFNLLSLFDPSSERISVHLELREMAVQLWKDHPLIGVGLGNYGALTGQGGELSSSHATFVTEHAEGGALGVTLLGTACLSVIIGLLREVRLADKTDELYPWALGMLGSTVAVVGNNTILYDTFWRDTTWSTFALALALTETLRRERVARATTAG